ncbi:pyridoxamine 5'-phosphate oxidase family protein [Salinirubellus salinus]|uniref:Pyridoxamine 5'-phosphate oxidase family protein n=1 Tax=Salinirubellus salinus TaxID=1364945 RepID=A0A9E7R5C4_9EURY|nr:pyridoxamine 5'-phosphate oxidase family protein [Salinirubellus salinus]UWM56099.1 pyridoxamine 5'-phosphate oxidase family protein [Salinirubellus salinus]
MVLTPPSVDHDRLRQAVHRSVTAEFAAASEGRPVVYPLTPFYDEGRECVVVTSPPAYAGKVEHVRENPAVALLLHGGSGGPSLLVRGTATVDDADVRANAEYVAGLIADEPDGEKRRAFTENGVLESRLGRLLMDWYLLRVVVRIDPTGVEEVTPAPTAPAVPAWPVVELGATEAGKHDRAVLGVCGRDGPTPVPLRGFEVPGDVATLDPVAPVPASEGDPACLLLHWHTPDVRQLGQRVVRGRVVGVSGDRVRLRAGSHFSMRRETRLDVLRSVVEGKRRTREYFGESGLTGWFF